MCLTHWGRVTHICVSKLSIIGSDNGLSPSRRQAIIWTDAGILLIRTLGTNFNEILSEIHAFTFKKMHLKMSSAKWRPFCLGLNVLKWWWFDFSINLVTLRNLQNTAVVMPTLSSLVAPEVVITTNSGARSNDKIGIMAILGFQIICILPTKTVPFGFACLSACITQVVIIALSKWNLPLTRNNMKSLRSKETR